MRREIDSLRQNPSEVFDGVAVAADETVKYG